MNPDGDSREYPFDASTLDLSGELPLLPLVGDVLFPGSSRSLGIEAPVSVALLESLKDTAQAVILVFAQRDPSVAVDTDADLHPVGVAARVIKTVGHTSGNHGVALQGLGRVQLEQLISKAPFLSARVRVLDGSGVGGSALDDLREAARRVVHLMPELPREATELVEQTEDAGVLADLVASRLGPTQEEKVDLLATVDAGERVAKVISLLGRLQVDLEERARAIFELKEPWPFAADGPTRIDAKVAAGEMTSAEAHDLRRYVDQGFVVWEGLVEPERVDALLTDIRSIKEHPGRFVTTDHRRSLPYRFTDADFDRYESIYDLYVNFESSRQVCFHPRILRFLELLFEERPIAFQQLLFQRSNQHPLHQDTAYVQVEDSLLMAATWVALEDVVPGRGELTYYEGSHRIPHYRFRDGSKRFNAEYDDPQAFARHIDEQCAALGCPKRDFIAKKGDVFLWSADLVHGSNPRTRPDEETRFSCVTHYCPERSRPFWFRNLQGNQGLEPHGDAAFMASSYYALPKSEGIVRPSFKLPEKPRSAT